MIKNKASYELLNEIYWLGYQKALMTIDAKGYGVAAAEGKKIEGGRKKGNQKVTSNTKERQQKLSDWLDNNKNNPELLQIKENLNGDELKPLFRYIHNRNKKLKITLLTLLSGSSPYKQMIIDKLDI